MVSSKCCQVESPSPFRFLAALIPPCAQTECERFTGTMEKRSTSPPISAILITAARPARPPPTTMIFGAAMLCLIRVLLAEHLPNPRFCPPGPLNFYFRRVLAVANNPTFVTGYLTMQSIGEFRHLLAIDEYSNGTIGIGLLLKGEKQAVHTSLCNMVDNIVEQLF